MTASKFSLAVAAAIAIAGIAVAAPTPRDRIGGPGSSKGDPQLDRAALFRPAQVGECGAVPQAQVAARAPGQRDARRAQRPERKTLAAAGCSVVWSD